MRRVLTRSRFDAEHEDPLGPMANLVDVMLVFACGLIAALFASRKTLEASSPLPRERAATVEQGQELPELPEGIGQAGRGYESLGRVYRDPDSGRLILIGDTDG